MTFQEYEEKIKNSLAKYVRDKNQDDRYTELILGLYEEAAEITSLIRRTIKGGYHEVPIDLKHLSEEIGDVLWYIAHISMQLPNGNLPKAEIEQYSKNTHQIYQKEVPQTQEEKLRYFCLGLIKNVGEVSEEFGEHRINGTELNISQIEKGLEKSLWNLIDICDAYNLDLEQIANENIIKVYSRYQKDGTVRKVMER